MKVILGAGRKTQDGWIATDRDTLDLTRIETFRVYFKGDRAEAFLAEHVWEHLLDGLGAAEICREFLVPGGRLRIAVPDALHPSETYQELVRPGGSGIGASGHLAFYDHLMLEELLKTAGFSRVVPLEWWSYGVFHRNPWKAEDGFIHRSADHDPRNRGGVLRYTSLIMDAIV